MIWEPVLLTDWKSPSTPTLARISDPRATQFWDKRRLISHSMGEHDRRSAVWDYIAVYPPGELWEDRLPEAVYHGGPVVRVIDDASVALGRALHRSANRIGPAPADYPGGRGFGSKQTLEALSKDRLDEATRTGSP